MNYLLDTDICIGIIRNALPTTVARLAHLRRDEVFLCSIVRFELAFGIERCARPADEVRRVERLWQQFASIDFDDNCADEAARLRRYLEKRGTNIGAYDTQIAAIARYHGLTILTRNRRDFERVPDLRVEDWEA